MHTPAWTYLFFSLPFARLQYIIMVSRYLRILLFFATLETRHRIFYYSYYFRFRDSASWQVRRLDVMNHTWCRFRGSYYIMFICRRIENMWINNSRLTVGVSAIWDSENLVSATWEDTVLNLQLFYTLVIPRMCYHFQKLYTKQFLGLSKRVPLIVYIAWQVVTSVNKQ